MRGPAYWVVCGAVLLLGVLTAFSIGLFVFPVGLALVVLGPVRHRPTVFWPVLLAVVGFVLGYLLFAPLVCSSTSTIPGGESDTVCTSILGPAYHVTGTANPPIDLALVAGAAGAVIGAAGAVVALSLRKRRRAS